MIKITQKRESIILPRKSLLKLMSLNSFIWMSLAGIIVSAIIMGVGISLWKKSVIASLVHEITVLRQTLQDQNNCLSSKWKVEK